MLEVENVSRSFAVKGAGMWGSKRLRVLDSLSMKINAGEAFGLLGESGSGKSTLAKTILNIHKPDSGSIRFDGRDLAALNASHWRGMRRELQYVSQDPLAALDPRKTILSQVAEPLVIHNLAKGKESRARAGQMLESVGMQPETFGRFPHQISGGQRQRAVIARSMILSPRLLICDEPVSALDVSIQAQVLNLLRDLWQDKGLTLLFISHDISVVRYLCDPVAVMYRGRLCEIAPNARIFDRPAHPYTLALMASVPDFRHGAPGSAPAVNGWAAPADAAPAASTRIVPPGQERGCAFAPRCGRASTICFEQVPALKRIAEGHSVACHHAAALVRAQ